MVMAVQSARHPFQLVFIAACLVAGVAGLLVPPRRGATALSRTLSPALVDLWNLGITLGAGLAVAAMLMRMPWTLWLERAAMLLLAGLFLSNAVAIFSVYLVASGFMLTGLGIACAARVWQITQDMARLKRMLADRQEPP